MTKSKWVGVLVVGALGLVAGYAVADQCTDASVSKQQWDWARKHVREAPTVLSFCQPCGDKMPKPWTGDLAHPGPNTDLAYIYVQVGDDNFANLAKLSGANCLFPGNYSGKSVATFIDRYGKPQLPTERTPPSP